MINDENKPAPIAFSVTSNRVNHYSDIVEYLASCQINNYRMKHNRMPSKEQIDFLKKEIIRYAVIRRDLETAQKIKIQESRLLNEENCLHTWIE